MPEHQLTMSIQQTDETFLMRMVAKGKLTHENYQQITPLIDQALESVEHPKVCFMIDAREMEGWELEAAWDDMKLGLKHGNKMKKIAIVGNKKWQALIAKMASWFIDGKAQYFENIQEAEDWVKQ